MADVVVHFTEKKIRRKKNSSQLIGTLFSMLFLVTDQDGIAGSGSSSGKYKMHKRKLDCFFFFHSVLISCNSINKHCSIYPLLHFVLAKLRFPILLLNCFRLVSLLIFSLSLSLHHFLSISFVRRTFFFWLFSPPTLDINLFQAKTRRKTTPSTSKINFRDEFSCKHGESERELNNLFSTISITL